MPGYRCLNDQAGYCSTKPAGEQVDIGVPTTLAIDSGYIHHFIIGSCKLDPQSCGFFITWQEVCRHTQPIEE